MCFKTTAPNDQYGPTQMPTPEDPMGRPATTEKLTKLGKLAKVLTPILAGGAMEGFGGRGTAANFFEQQDLEAQRKRAEARQGRMDSLTMAKGQADLAAPQFQPGSPYELAGEGGNDLYDRDPYTGGQRKLGRAPVKEPTGLLDVVQGPSSYFGIDRSKGTAAPIMTNDPAALPGLPSEPGMFGEEVRQPQPPQIPLTAPVKLDSQSEPQLVTDTDASGVSTSHFVDKNPKSPTFGKEIGGKQPVSTRHPKPTAADKAPKPADIEQFAQEALKAEGNDGDKAVARINGLPIPEELRAPIRNRIREIKRPGQPKPSIFDRLGINPANIK